MGMKDCQNDDAMVREQVPSFKLIRITPDDATRRTDVVSLLTGQLAKHEGHYPNIQGWTTNKVIPGLRTGERVAYIGLQDETPILVAVVKRGERSKFCHLSIQEGFRDNKFGKLMFSLMAAEVRQMASEVHFTLPESVWLNDKKFFQMFGFMDAKFADRQYRMFEDELRCSASFSIVWSRVLRELPAVLGSASISGFGSGEGVVLSVQERHAMAIVEGRKSIEIRRRFSERSSGRRASVYAAGGLGALVGEVTIKEVLRGRPSAIWEQFGPEVGCSYPSFSKYVGVRPEIFALKLSDPKPYTAPVPLSQLCHILGEYSLSPPQSYRIYGDNDKWSRALTVAALLHGVTDLGNYSGSIVSEPANVQHSRKTIERRKTSVAIDVEQGFLDL